MRRLLSLLLLGVALAPGGPASAAGATPATAALDLVGHESLGGRGMNAALAVADHCAYVGSRDDAPPMVVDIADPAHPAVAGQLAAHAGSTPRELRAVPSERLLVVMFYALQSGAANRLEVYRWTSDCRTPMPVGAYDFGAQQPHEFYLWQDPARPARVLVFQAFFSGGFRGLEVIDLAQPEKPRLAGTWNAVATLGGAANLHSIALSADAREAYLALWNGGLLLADTSDFAAGLASPALRLLTPPGNALHTPPGNVHSAVPLPGRRMLLLTDEIYPPPYGAGCPYGHGTIADIRDVAHPVAVSTLTVPENDQRTCGAAPFSTWTSHNPTLTANLALVTWYSAGLQVFDIGDPAHPTRLAEYRAALGGPRARDPQLGASPTMSWSYPVIHAGLIYVADINQGLLVLRYRGPHQEEIARVAAAEGNSNVAAAVTPSPAPSPLAATPSSHPSPTPVVPARPASPGWWPPAAALAIAAGAGAAVVLRRRSRVT